MSWLSKFIKGAEVGAQVAQVVAPSGKAANIAKLIEQVIDDEKDPQNLGALRILASRVVDCEMRLAHIEDLITPKR